ncbi:hypothetical protein GOODEAATRI_028528 [Goodea atripinnis]|uniref:Uncharacterized protein n=1 Tax=Goodea atripinnis TaxID=208336 RepID=A0ABV0NEF4_9TELE
MTDRHSLAQTWCIRVQQKCMVFFVTLFFSFQEQTIKMRAHLIQSVQGFFQWVSGQAHVPLTDAKRDSYQITVNFDHEFTYRYGSHTLCFPIVNGCAVAITFPTQQLTTYDDFENRLT